MAERGSILPLYLGLAAFGLTLLLFVSQFVSAITFRESLNEYADQSALLLASSPELSQSQLLARLRALGLAVEVKSAEASVGSDSTATVRLCATWISWVKLPGISGAQEICQSASAR